MEAENTEENAGAENTRSTKNTKNTITTKHTNTTVDIRPLLTNLNDPVMLRSVEKALQGENVTSGQSISSVVDKSVADMSNSVADKDESR